MDDQKAGDPWMEVFSACGSKIDVNEKVNQVNEWGLDIMDMLHADKQDRDQLCEDLRLEGRASKEFPKAVDRALIKYSQWSFLRDMVSEEKQSDQLIHQLNEVEKPASMVTDDDIKRICDECEVNVSDVRNIIGWYKTLQPLTGQTKGAITPQNVCAMIKQLYTTFDLPFFAMEEADDEDVDQLAGDLKLSKEQIEFFKCNVAAQLKLAGLMTLLKE